MIVFQVATLALLTMVSVALGYVALLNIASCIPESRWPKASTLFVVSLLGLTLPIVSLALFLSVEIALTAISTAGFACALIAYFLGQRFEAPVFASNLVQKKPTILPTVTLVFLSFSISFLGMSAGWLWSVLSIPIWLVLGYLSVELAIRREQRRSAKHGVGFSREMAIFALNQNQGRGQIMFSSRHAADRYPFP